MNPQTQFCHTLDCPTRGMVGQGNIRIFSRKPQRYDCKVCGKTFTATKGTPFYRLRTAVDLVTLVLTLLVHGCPLQAIVAAFGFDERTVADWPQRAGSHAQPLHEAIIEQGQVDLHMCRPMNYGSSWSADGSGWRWPWPCPHDCGWAG